MLSLSPHHHSAKLTAHTTTSYGGLGVVLGLGGILIVLLTLGVVLPGNADSGALAVTASVPGPPPDTAPVITAPASGSTVTSQQLAISGSCSGDDTIVVVSNQVVRGAAFCDHDSTFNLTISLDTGTNLITTHYVDSLNQSGPDSAPVTVTYQSAVASATPTAPVVAASRAKPPSPTATGSPGAAGSGLAVTAPYHFDPVQPGSSFTLTGDIENGTAPFALEIDWGDGTQTLVSRLGAGAFSEVHIYTRAGRYVIKLSTSDVTGATDVFQTVLTVTGATAAAPVQPTNPSIVIPAYQLMIIWPLFLGACVVVGSFWLGERYDRRHWQLPSPRA